MSLLGAVLIFGAANAVVRKLTDLGSTHLVAGRNPISFCNVLFVGNLCALLLLTYIYAGQLGRATWRKLTTAQILAMLTSAILGTALAPALVFSALEDTPVNTVVLVSRIEPPLILALSVILLDERVNRWVVAGAGVSFLGVVLSILLAPHKPNDPMMGLANGEFLVALAAIALALSTMISKISLRDVPLGLFSIVRLSLGTAVFFTLAIVLFGPHHFADVGSPFLLRWMLFYAAFIVVAGQLLWYTGLRNSTAGEVSLASTLNPVAGFIAAFLILGESPSLAQLVGGFFVLSGMALNQYGLRQLGPGTTTSEPAQPIDAEIGFKGV